jgi:Bacterial Ig domain
VLGFGADLDVKMTLSHNAACAIWTNAASISVKDVTITAAPQHGTLALRGRTGVTYRPARGFTGTDSFAFTLQSTSAPSVAALTARVQATVR